MTWLLEAAHPSQLKGEQVDYIHGVCIKQISWCCSSNEKIFMTVTKYLYCIDIESY